MHRFLIAGMALATITAPASAQTQPSEQSIANGVRALGATWQRIVANQEVLIVSCPMGGFSAYRLSRNTAVSVDLRKTDSLLNPYIGYVNLTGEFEHNASQQNDACHPSIEQALASPDFWENKMTYNFALTYQVVDGELRWTSADPVFMTNGGNAMANMTKGTNPDWGKAVARLGEATGQTIDANFGCGEVCCVDRGFGHRKTPSGIAGQERLT